MHAVPRLRDTLRVELSGSGSAAQFVVHDLGGRELFRLTAEGWTLLTLLDGLASPEEVRAGYRDRVGRDMPEDELGGFIEALRAAGVLHDDPAAVEALTYLRAQGLHYRSPGPDRRRLVHPDSGAPDDPRGGGERRRDREREQAWGLAVLHLNEGRVDRARDAFERLVVEEVADVRSREFLHHLRFLAARAKRPELGDDRRDAAWRAFDEALSAMLEAGLCPRCGAPIEVQLGGVNRCGSCGSSFSAYAVARARDEVPPPDDEAEWPWIDTEDAS